MGCMKACGGYHPDWLIRWTGSDGQFHELHICFGCHEAKLYGDHYQLYCDVADAPCQTLRSILFKYASQRPRKAEQSTHGKEFWSSWRTVMLPATPMNHTSTG